MFEAIRSKLVGAWTDLRSRGLVTLFFFELVVITLGVLLAQAIADWSSERQSRDRFEASLERYDVRASLNYGTVQGWQVLAPCLRDRIDAIMRRAGQGEDVPPEWLERPVFLGLSGVPFGDEENLLLLREKGTERHLAYSAIEAQRVSIDTGSEALTDLWALLAVLDTRKGSVSEGDRVNARLTAAQMLAALKRIENSGVGFVRSAEALGLKPDFRDNRLARSCDEVWRHGSHVPLPGEDG